MVVVARDCYNSKCAILRKAFKGWGWSWGWPMSSNVHVAHVHAPNIGGFGDGDGDGADGECAGDCISERLILCNSKAVVE